MFRYVAAAVFLLSQLHSLSQQQARIDSLEKLLTSSIADSELVSIYNQLAEEFVNVDSATAHQYANQAIELSEQINHEIGIIRARIHIGWIYIRSGHGKAAEESFKVALNRAQEDGYDQGQADAFYGLGTVYTDRGLYKEANEYLQNAIQKSEKLSDKKILALTYNQLGILNAYQGDYRTCLAFFLKALEIQIERGDEQKIAGNFNNIAIVYEELDQPQKALEYYQKALAINQKLENKRGIALNYNNINTIYRNLGMHAQAFEYLQKALEINREIKNKRGIASNLGSIASYHQEEGDLEVALEYLYQALELRKELGDLAAIAATTNQIGEVLLAQMAFQAAISHFEKANLEARKIGNMQLYHGSLGNLAKAYEHIGNYKQAYQYHVLFKEVTDSLVNDENNENIARLEAEFEFKQEKDSIALAQVTERTLLEAEIKQRKHSQIILSIGIGLLLVLLSLIGYLYRSKQLTNRKLLDLNQDISEHRDHLQKINQTKTRLFSIISHDIRGPMSVFIGFSDILIDYIKNNYNAAQDAELKKIRVHLKQASSRLLELMDDMVSWAQKEEGVVPYHPKLFKTKKLIEEAKASIEPLAQAKSIHLNMNVDNDQTVWVDRNSCKTILRNLISNAIKFTPEEGTITISADESNGNARIYISDTGIGIPQDKLEQLFELGKEKVRRGTNGEKGTGLGLNVVKEFIHMNKGSIDVYSEEDKGTTFTIALPKSEVSLSS